MNKRLGDHERGIYKTAVAQTNIVSRFPLTLFQVKQRDLRDHPFKAQIKLIRKHDLVTLRDWCPVLGIFQGR